MESMASSRRDSSPSLLRSSSIKDLEPNNLHLLIDRLSEAAAAATSATATATAAGAAEELKNGRIPQRFRISLYSDLAKLHRKAIVPFIPRIMASIIRFFSPDCSPSSSSSSPHRHHHHHHHHQQQQQQQLLLLYEASAKVVSSIARYTIDPTSSASYNKEILDSLCAPLLSSLVNRKEEREGAALCLQSIVESEKWKYSDPALHRLLCDCIDSVLRSVYSSGAQPASCLSGSDTCSSDEGHGANRPQADDDDDDDDALCVSPSVNGAKSNALGSTSLRVAGISTSPLHPALALDANHTELGANAQLNSNHTASNSGVNETQLASLYDFANSSGLALGLGWEDIKMALDHDVNRTQLDTTAVDHGGNGNQSVSPLDVHGPKDASHPCMARLSTSPLPSSASVLVANACKWSPKARLNGNCITSAFSVNETRMASTSGCANLPPPTLGIGLKDALIPSDFGINRTQSGTSALEIGGVNGTQSVSPRSVNGTLSCLCMSENGPEPVAILHLIKSVIKFCSEVARSHALEWFKLGLSHLERKKKGSSWHHRVASAQLISIILKTYNLLESDLDLNKVKDVIQACQVHDHLPVVRAALAEALEALIGCGQSPCETALSNASSSPKGFAPVSIASLSLHNNVDRSPSLRMENYTKEVKSLPFYNSSASLSFSSAKPTSTPEWDSHQVLNSQIPQAVDLSKNALRSGSLGSEKDFTGLGFHKEEESDGSSYRGRPQCDESKSESTLFHKEGDMSNDLSWRLSRQVDDALCNGCSDLLLTPDGKMEERFEDSGDVKNADMKPRLCVEDFVFATPRRILHSLQSDGDIIEVEAMQSDNRRLKRSESSVVMEGNHQGCPSSSCCTSEEMNLSQQIKEQKYRRRRAPKSRAMSSKCSCEDNAKLVRDTDGVHKATELLERCLSVLDSRTGEHVGQLSRDLKTSELELLDKGTKLSSSGSGPIQSKMEKLRSRHNLECFLCVTFALSAVLIALIFFQRMDSSRELHVLVPT